MSQPALDAIRQLYFAATRATIARDFDRAVELLKSMASEDERERAAVYMEGLAEMRAQWAIRASPASAAQPSGGPRARSGQSKRGGRRSR